MSSERSADTRRLKRPSERSIGRGSMRSAHSCPAAPVMRPTIDEFRDFAAYVAKIEPEIRAVGGCQIIPPPEWAHHKSVPDGTPLTDRVEQCLTRAPDTRITPLRQHLAGRDGRLQAVMELLDSTPLSSFIKKSDEQVLSKCK